jgi:hypothetical protein
LSLSHARCAIQLSPSTTFNVDRRRISRRGYNCARINQKDIEPRPFATYSHRSRDQVITLQAFKESHNLALAPDTDQSTSTPRLTPQYTMSALFKSMTSLRTTSFLAGPSTTQSLRSSLSAFPSSKPFYSLSPPSKSFLG